jgi:hypothetical protein
LETEREMEMSGFETRMRVPDSVFDSELVEYLKHRLTLVTLPENVVGKLVKVEVGPRVYGVVSVEFFFDGEVSDG